MMNTLKPLSLAVAVALAGCAAGASDSAPPEAPPPPPPPPPAAEPAPLPEPYSQAPADQTAPGSTAPQPPGSSSATAAPPPPPPPAPPAQAAASSDAPLVYSYPSGQWVYVAGPGWTWVPAGATTYDMEGVPYAYLYTPAYGWTWYVSPWGPGFYRYGVWVRHPWHPVGRHGYWVARPHVVVRLGGHRR